MEILVNQLPSGGYEYNFPSISLKPMSFLDMVKYMESAPEGKIEKYIYDIKLLIAEDSNIANCYVMDLDFLIFYKKLISVSNDMTYNLTVTCSNCGSTIKKRVSLDRDIKFNQIDSNLMNGARIELCGNEYDTKVPTVQQFLDVLSSVQRYKSVNDLDIIKTMSIIGDFSNQGNQIQKDVLNATHNDITLLIALKELYFDRLDTIKVGCPSCSKDTNTEERREMTVSVNSLIVDFFRDICNNCPIDGSKILFK